MATLTTKYSVGDVVFYASTYDVIKQHPCPDCKGSRQWKAVAPSGQEYTFGCPRCSTRFYSDTRLSLKYAAFDPIVTKMTIGQVRAVSPPTQFDQPAEYMCVETGVGSGTVYREDRLFLHEDEAMACATALALQQNKSNPHCVETFKASLEVSDYELADAREHAEKKELEGFQWKVRDLICELEAADTMDDVRKALLVFEGKEEGAWPSQPA